MGEQFQADADGYLVSLAHRIPALGRAASHSTADWPPAGALLADADASGVDLIALTTHGRGGVERLLLGSVADKVVRGTTRPVLLCRPPSAEAN